MHFLTHLLPYLNSCKMCQPHLHFVQVHLQYQLIADILTYSSSLLCLSSSLPIVLFSVIEWDNCQMRRRAITEMELRVNHEQHF